MSNPIRIYHPYCSSKAVTDMVPHSITVMLSHKMLKSFLFSVTCRRPSSCRLFCSLPPYKQSLFMIPSDKPYRQLLVADGKYFWIRFQNESNTDFSELIVPDEEQRDMIQGRNARKDKKWWQQFNSINGGHFYIISRDSKHINHARNLLTRFCQSVQYHKLPSPECAYAIIGDMGSNRVEIQKQCNVSLFLNMNHPLDLWMVPRELTHSNSNKTKKSISSALSLIQQLTTPFVYRCEAKYCYLITKNARYFNRRHDVSIAFDRNTQFKQYTRSLDLNIYGFHDQIQHCIEDIKTFIAEHVHEVKVEGKYFNLLVGKEAQHLVQLSYLLNADIHCRKRDLLILFADKQRIASNPKSLKLFQKCLDDVITHKIHEMERVHKMRFQRLLYSAEWKALSKDVTFEYQYESQTLRYWIHCGLHSIQRPPAPSVVSNVAIFGEPNTIGFEGGDLIKELNDGVDAEEGDDTLNGLKLDLSTVSDEEKAITERVHKLVHWHCTEELMSGMDIRPGFMPLIRGVDGKHIMELQEECKMEYARNVIRHSQNHIKMPKTRMQLEQQTDAVTLSGEYVLDTFMRDSKDGKWEGNDAHKIWIFCNNATLMRMFKLKLFRMCKDGEIMWLIRELADFQKELGTERQFHIEKGMMKTNTRAKIYSNGTELYILGTEEERESAKKWVRQMLQEWKLRFIGSQQAEELKLATIRKDYQDLNRTDHTETVSEANDSDLLARF